MIELSIIENKEENVEEEKVKIIVPYENKRDYYVNMVPKMDGENDIVATNYQDNDLEKYDNEDTLVEEDYVYKLNYEVEEEIENEQVGEDKGEDKIEEDIEVVSEEEGIKEEVPVLVSEDNEEIDTEVKEEPVVEDIVPLKNGFITENNETYYYENDNRVTGVRNIDGVNHYFNTDGKLLSTNKAKVVDVSYYQKDIDWDTFVRDSDCYGVILRLGYYNTLDKKFERNINELKRLGIPYGIYLFSYSTTLNGASIEGNFTNKMIDKYDLNPTLGIYYDIESWSTKSSNSNNISKSMYDNIIQLYINKVSDHISYRYKVKVYSGRWYAMNRLGSASKKFVDWVAEYNSTCKYDDSYSMWQYTSKGSVPGINGNVDISYLY